jgi:hypothetical protein
MWIPRLVFPTLAIGFVLFSWFSAERPGASEMLGRVGRGAHQPQAELYRLAVGSRLSLKGPTTEWYADGKSGVQTWVHRRPQQRAQAGEHMTREVSHVFVGGYRLREGLSR